MRAGEAAAKAGVTVKALRYYETVGLLRPARRVNGYRDYSAADVRIAVEVRRLMALGLSPREAEPFLSCLDAGHEHADDCAESLAAYQSKIRELDRLSARVDDVRRKLADQLREAAHRGFPAEAAAPPAPPLPATLPAPADDGAAAHLAGLRLPPLTLPSTDGDHVQLDTHCRGRWIVFVYPMTGDPAADLPSGWSDIPGARGCTAQACGFRDAFADIIAAGVDEVIGLSVDLPRYQRHLARRLHLPYPLVSDGERALATTLRLSTFEAGGMTLYRRLTMVVRGAEIEHVFYPIFPPDQHAAEVVEWLQQH